MILPVFWNSMLIEKVQYLLLMTQYLQGTQKSVQTWTIHGLAVKSAFSIGLHSANASRNLSPLDAEVRKRTWFGCILLDRYVLEPYSNQSKAFQNPEYDIWSAAGDTSRISQAFAPCF